MGSALLDIKDEVAYPDPVYVKTIAAWPLGPEIDHKLWEYGILDVGKPLVLNLNAIDPGRLFSETQLEFSAQEDEIKLFPFCV